MFFIDLAQRKDSPYCRDPAISSRTIIYLSQLAQRVIR